MILKRFFYYFVRKNCNTVKYFIYGEFGRYLLTVNCKLKIIRYWLKTIIDKHNTLVYNMYQSTYRNCENGISLHGRTATIKSLLFSLGIKFVCYDHGVVTVKLFEHVLKQRLQDNHNTEWNRAVSNSNDEFCTEHINSSHFIVNS